jgi:uncharacterized protein (TIGR03083 family)
VRAGQVFLTERAALVATMESLTAEDFDSGQTLCAEWAPRDVLGHLLGIDASFGTYLRHPWSVAAANAVIVAEMRRKGRDELLELARRWAARPATGAAVAAPLLLGDLAIHHEDVLRPRARHRDVPTPLARAVVREGLLLGGVRRLAGHRLEPTDGQLRPFGIGRPVRGSTTTLGLWLSGRAVTAELEFG